MRMHNNIFVTGDAGVIRADFVLGSAAGSLRVQMMSRGMAWLDTGTHDSLFEAGLFIQTVERRQGLKIACPEEIAWRLGYVTAGQLEALADPIRKSGYGQYLLNLLREPYFSAEADG
jgi:glucose-1-phosphate thymidylyltransferase